MFNLREFLMIGFRDAIGKLNDYQVIFNATGWNEKGVLTEDDLAELGALIEKKNTPVVIPEVEEPTEEVVEETTEEVVEENVE